MLIYTRAMDPEHPLVDGRGMSQAHSDSREQGTYEEPDEKLFLKDEKEGVERQRAKRKCSFR